MLKEKAAYYGLLLGRKSGCLSPTSTVEPSSKCSSPSGNLAQVLSDLGLGFTLALYQCARVESLKDQDECPVVMVLGKHLMT